MRPPAWGYAVRRCGPVSATVAVWPLARPELWELYRVAWAGEGVSVRPLENAGAKRTAALLAKLPFGDTPGILVLASLHTRKGEQAVRRRIDAIRQARQ